MTIDITKMSPQEFLARALNHRQAVSFLGMVALQLEGNAKINQLEIAAALDRVAATLDNREAAPEPSRLAIAAQDERDRESLPHAHRNLNLPEIEAAADDRMAMIEF